jgi:hypothetical protein
LLYCFSFDTRCHCFSLSINIFDADIDILLFCYFLSTLSPDYASPISIFSFHFLTIIFFHCR